METIQIVVCEECIGGGSLDWSKLQEYIDEILNNSAYIYDDIISEATEISGGCIKFNDLMYATLSIYEKVIKEKMIKFYPELEEQIWGYEVPIHVNYMDSSLDDECWWYDLRDYNRKEAVDDILEKWEILKDEGNKNETI